MGALPKGTVVAGRFLIELLAGRGGMGSVYRAMDSSRGEPVALKLLHGNISPDGVARFNRESVLLSGLRHPGIVAYVAHGTTEERQPYLAMEWLEGEDLARRLSRKPLSLPEALAVIRRAAEALATAHGQGIVHRDLKPSNLFLRGGRPEDVVLLDFGLARHAAPSLLEVTGSGVVVGTPGYMAPEQASSEPEIPPAADIFSLGCVLYECLTGQPPFVAPHFAAALAKILYAEPPPLTELRPGLPRGLQVLMDRMLAKSPLRRVADADKLLEVLATLESVPELLLPQGEARPRPQSLAGAERKLISVMLASPPAMVRHDEETADGNWGVTLRDSLRTDLAPYGARVELLADGSLVATLLPERGSATDQAALAARCALAFKERWPEASVVVVTGLGVFNERLPVGEVMDRAGRLLREVGRLSASSQVVMDEVTAGLLGGGFRLSRVDSGTFLLRGEQLGADESRPLMGKPTPCVGREQELGLLDFTFNGCVEEPASRVLLVTAPAGTGKSRLRHEFLRRMEKREHPPLVLLGRGDSMSTGAAYGLLGQALRRLCGVVEGEAGEASRERLSRRLALHLSEARARETVEFLGELCAIPFPEEDSPRLRAARGDPRLMSAQVGRALGAFLEAECAHHPVLLVLEDLHWGDALTVTLVEVVLRTLPEQPLMVLALARPEVKQLFPGLWARRLQEVPLHGLGSKASARLVREVLGAQVPDALVRRVVEMSDGNALLLEELIRMAAEGRGEETPETVLAVLQARLQRMEPGARQVLLAASIFGRAFWPGGVTELLGGQVTGELLESHLRELVAQEVIERQSDSHFPAQAEYRFRHALVRDAAYGLVADSHRPVGHRLAADWLERGGESDLLVLATHHQLGEQPERAGHFYLQAAERLFERHDLPGTVRCVASALSCGVHGEALTRLRALEATAAFWMDQFPRTLELGMPVQPGVKAGSPLWCRLMAGLILASFHEGQQAQGATLVEQLMRTTPEPAAVPAYVEAIALLGLPMSWAGERAQMEGLLGRLMQVGAGEPDALTRGWTAFTKSYFIFLFEPRPWQAFQVAEQGMRDFREIGSERNALLLQTLAGLAQASLGEVPAAVERMREAMELARRAEQHVTMSYVQHYLSLVLASTPEPENWREARGLLREYMGSEDPHSFRWCSGMAMLAKMDAASGELSEAESRARQACELLAPFLSYLTLARAIHSGVLLAQGRAAEAREVAGWGVKDVERMHCEGTYAVSVRLALAEACLAQGDGEAGEAALREALRCVRARARDIPEPEARERFLREVPENARTLELARERWGESAA